MKRISLLLALIAALTFAGTASAAPSQTPVGYCGALNMVASWPGAGPAQGVGVQSGGGMENAMSVDNAAGNEGMFLAVSRSDCR